MFEMYIESEGKKLRCGYTTGSCATAAAKAATYTLIHGKTLDFVTINTPSGMDIDIPIFETNIYEDYVECFVIKDGGDDIDATHGIKIGAKVKKSSNFLLDGGEGVGRVKADGLNVKKGEAAINPVPRKMIEGEVKSLLKSLNYSVEVVIFVPEGKNIAKKTFNPRLNIEGGISILGTTGIVYPMSEDAIKASIELEIRQKSLNFDELIFVFGHIGEDYGVELGFKRDNMVIISNYVGFALQSCLTKNIKKVTLIGHIGKMCKIAYGCFNTHSKVCGVRLEVLALEMALLGYDMKKVNEVLAQKTTDGAVDILGEGNEELYKVIAKKIKDKCEEHVYREFKVDVVMYAGTVNHKFLSKA
ncbi:cobalt-precorrin-5B (C(1))-methyltransferase CbiD [Clostridium fallax]|uniref:Cobalt-precorrin-5B C(1)-methyltransferase n=1 Tax=Clostridium fallax TaxID=1533 RepID=A0A1M4Y2G5_9CLOT|nr:cobalt-precorrin-5B (C(1))-methyltransferase CbiD [Clostridium fallax]SHE99880.1 cobalt-precorrin 5B C1-methyltransferase [Clostridium fallax]SQB07785.1 cobalt-precorrin-6A synthase [Clostridium fallax]